MPVGRLGLAICYDMRFPALFEALGRRAAMHRLPPLPCPRARRTGT
jgi:predicted amidohydrolase